MQYLLLVQQMLHVKGKRQGDGPSSNTCLLIVVPGATASFSFPAAWFGNGRYTYFILLLKYVGVLYCVHL